MSLNRNEFLETFARSTPSLKLIFMNHLGTPSKLLTDVTAIDLLSDKQSLQNFTNYCKIHPLVQEIIQTNEYRQVHFLLKFRDGSELIFRLISNIVRKSLLCLDTEAIRNSASINSYGMLVPSPEHHFEYNIVKYQFLKESPPERYQNYFSAYPFNIRSVIFKYLQTRYNLVFNVLEDLYVPKNKTLLSLLIGLRSEKQNTLLRMFIRVVGQLFFKVFRFAIKKPRHISTTTAPGEVPALRNVDRKRATSKAV